MQGGRYGVYGAKIKGLWCRDGWDCEREEGGQFVVEKVRDWEGTEAQHVNTFEV